MPGVWRTRVGYAGGTLANPTYHRLGDHTEAFQVDFDPAVVTYEKLLEVVFASHNPCGKTWSRQYMSAVFHHDDRQKRLAEAARDRIPGARTPVLPVGVFTPAEDYHQKYELQNDELLKREFRAMYPGEADFMNSTAAMRANAIVAGNGTALRGEAGRYGLSEEARRRLLSYVLAK